VAIDFFRRKEIFLNLAATLRVQRGRWRGSGELNEQVIIIGNITSVNWDALEVRFGVDFAERLLADAYAHAQAAAGCIFPRAAELVARFFVVVRVGSTAFVVRKASIIEVHALRMRKIASRSLVARGFRKVQGACDFVAILCTLDQINQSILAVRATVFFADAILVVGILILVPEAQLLAVTVCNPNARILAVCSISARIVRLARSRINVRALVPCALIVGVALRSSHTFIIKERAVGIRGLWSAE
jgi:hypothetical protein